MILTSMCQFHTELLHFLTVVGYYGEWWYLNWIHCHFHHRAWYMTLTSMCQFHTELLHFLAVVGYCRQWWYFNIINCHFHHGAWYMTFTSMCQFHTEWGAVFWTLFWVTSSFERVYSFEGLIYHFWVLLRALFWALKLTQNLYGNGWPYFGDERFDDVSTKSIVISSLNLIYWLYKSPVIWAGMDGHIWVMKGILWIRMNFLCICCMISFGGFLAGCLPCFWKFLETE